MANIAINSLNYNNDNYIFTIPYGVCSTAAGTAAKTVEVENFSLEEGAVIIVKFTNANSASSPTLNVNSTGAKAIMRYGTTAASTSSSTSGWVAGAVQLLVYDGTNWVRDYWNNSTYSNVSLGQGYTTCTTAAATVAKTASLSSYALSTGGIVSVKFSYDVPASATLNINSKGAKAIYHNGAAITAGIIKAGNTATFIYDGTRYQLIAIDVVYKADAGIQLDGTTFKHTNSVTAKTSGTQATAAPGYSGTFTVMEPLYDAQGHITGTSSATITMPAAQQIPTELKNPNSLTIGNIVYDGSAKKTVTAADLGITGAMLFKGTSSTEITDGGTQAPTIGGTAVATSNLQAGNVVLYGNQEFVWNSSAWELLGDEGSYALKGHTHNYAGSSSEGGAATSANKVNSSLSIQLNGGTATVFDGSAVKTINITPAAIGAAAASHGTHVTYSTTAPVVDGVASAGSASTVARSDHKHPTDTTRAAASDLNDHTGNTTVHITSEERTDWNAAKTHADSAHAPTDAEKNQNAFSNVIVGTTTIEADKATDTLTFVAGSNITLTPDATNDKITIAAKDTIYTHPSHTAANSGFYKFAVNSLGHVTSVTAVAKSDITALGIPAQDTTYGAENGIKLTNGKFGHSNTTITAGTVGTAQSPNHGDTFTIPSITYDAYGHITGATTVNITLPADSNTDTKVTQTRTTTSSWRPILSHATYKDYGVDPGAATAAAYYHETMAIQPSTGTIRATTFKGALDGNATTATNVAWSGVTSKPTYYDGKAITSITRSGTTFTATYLDGSTTTFTQQDNNTTYSVMTAATASAAGKSGLVPAPAAGKQGQFLRGDGTWATPTNTTYSAMTGATSSAAGKSGLVPAPAAGDNTKFLRGDGTWVVPTNTNTTYTIATGDSNGQIKVTPSSGSAYNVSVKGLGSAAYTASTAYDAAGSANTALTNAKAYTDTKVAALVDSAPETLDTLNELAAALGDDPNFATTIATSIGTKANSSVTITAGNGLTGGGDLTTDRTLTVGAGAGISVTANAVALATSGVTAGTYGPSANVTGSSQATINVPQITVDAYGRITSASSKTYTTMTIDNAMSASSTNPVQNKVIKAYVDSKAVDTSSFLPRSAGIDYPLTGPLGLTAGQNYGATLPTSGFNGQLFFLEDTGAILPSGGTAGQYLVKNSDAENDASWQTLTTTVSNAWTGGTTAGPTLTTTVNGVTGTAVAIPVASASASGVVTTGAQTFAGNKTFAGANTYLGATGATLYMAYNGSNFPIIQNYNNANITVNPCGGGLYLGYSNTTGIYFGASGAWGSVNSNGIYGAVWNDYAEYRNQFEEIEPGYCVASADNGKVYKTTEKFQACDGIVSDTAGFYIGQTDECQTPLAVAGRVLAYFHGNREDYHAGDTVCAGPEGKVMKMTREEIREWPDRIVGIVSEIPEYETWGTGNVEVNGRIWIKVK